MTINKYEAAYFSSIAYDDDKLGFTLDQSYKNQGWKQLKNSNELGLSSDDYYGTCYVKVVNGAVTDVVIAHRGTEANLSDIIVSDGAIALNLPTNNQVDNANGFVNKLKEEYLKLSSPENPIILPSFNSITTQTGHSLGGYLAIKAANNQSSSTSHIKAITFDNPKAGFTAATNKADVETYLNQPNIVNSAGSGDHVGKVYRLDAESAVFDNKAIAALNVMFAQTAQEHLINSYQ